MTHRLLWVIGGPWSPTSHYTASRLHSLLLRSDPSFPPNPGYGPIPPSNPLFTAIADYGNHLILNHGWSPGLVHPSQPSRSRLEEVKSQLPSTRSRISELAPDAHSPPSSDPDCLHDMIASFWGTTWSPRTDTPPIDPYLQTYHKRLRTRVHLPSLEEVTDLILTCGSSSPGPDGVPFGVYKTLIDVSAPLLHSCLIAISKGVPTPPDYNLGLLYLIPKTEERIVSSTRPITVTNTDNRLLARMVTAKLNPALSLILSPAQQLFLQGRNMNSHVDSLFHTYFSSLSRNHQLFVLFLDTKKAFDSIDHNFILKVAKRISLPEWILTSIRFFLYEVEVSPVLSGSLSKRIPIRRGVKQGCPLSPTLFVMCFDVLLAKLPLSVTPYAAADDLALSSSTLSPLLDSILCIDDFSAHSGLGINADKSALLSTLPHPPLHSWIRASPWPALLTPPYYKYLGIRLGPQIRPLTAFQPMLDKFQARASRMLPYIRKLPILRRGLVINTWLLSLFSYFIQFFIIPDPHVKTIQRTIRWLMDPYHTAMPYSLIVQDSPISLPHPPKDIWALNIASLIHKRSLPDRSRAAGDWYDQVTRDDPIHLHHPLGMDPSEMRRRTLIEYAWCHSPWGVGYHENPEYPIPADLTNSRAKIYRHALNSPDYGYDFPTVWRAKLARLAARLRPYGPLNPQLFITQARHFPKDIPPLSKEHLFRLLTYSFRTTSRGRFNHDHQRHLPVTHDHFPCRFCTQGVDQLGHLLYECPTLREFWTILRTSHSYLSTRRLPLTWGAAILLQWDLQPLIPPQRRLILTALSHIPAAIHVTASMAPPESLIPSAH